MHAEIGNRHGKAKLTDVHTGLVQAQATRLASNRAKMALWTNFVRHEERNFDSLRFTLMCRLFQLNAQLGRDPDSDSDEQQQFG